ncbi:TraR/DksA family transcriptional regulator [Arenicella xantha]|uniref:TraR/DksA family transcriptional regulator n=1 Tax=Arenicella xantha TaxID=644221 RepID=A0A395JMN6_9GAMM|nr:TraR/DksA C4-type zinc finger protein [Arenicella xantha]RBP50898.1 TraR/DksA family transcriptional regulator [Arenicella xantha]
MLLNKQQQKFYKNKLELLREQAQRTIDSVNLSAKPVVLDQNSVGRLSRMDAMQGQAMAQASERRQIQLIKCIDQALLRLVNGSYGLCFECSEAIPAARLEIDLTAEYCIGCAALRE